MSRPFLFLQPQHPLWRRRPLHVAVLGLTLLKDMVLQSCRRQNAPRSQLRACKGPASARASGRLGTSAASRACASDGSPPTRSLISSKAHQS
jgi:hypothetical protein